MKLSVIIVNYNVKYFLEQCLLSVRKAATLLPCEVFVVDNNSVDDSVRMVDEKFPEVHLIANKENTGFAVANNQAMRLAKGEYVLLLNPDTVVEEDTFVKCVDFMDAHPEAGGLGVKMIDGSGTFLPESKRGFPSPWVAFCKTFGLAKLFPKSKRFNSYHLGYLDRDETHEIDVLAGAFMLMRSTTLKKVGLLDEAFFMYGEDIDLSYRIVKGGYKNYYFPATTIIHYKGESTKKGSLNYVRVFYQAMIIFARKHFAGEQAWLFILMLRAAIYLRAGLTLLRSFVKQMALPLIEAAVIILGLLLLRNLWAEYYFRDPNYYSPSFVYVNIPLYTSIWLGSVFFSGGYDAPFELRRLFRGLAIGTVVLAAVYGFLDLELRASRMLVIFGAVWAFVATFLVRTIWHYFLTGNINIGRSAERNTVVVGSDSEASRVQTLLTKAAIVKNIIGIIAPNESNRTEGMISDLSQLDEVVQIYKVNEIIFCSRDVRSQDIMAWMSKLGNRINYKILPEKSLSIIGSDSKNTAGELYTIDIRYQIADPANKRAKRFFDFTVSILLLVLAPILLVLSKNRTPLYSNLFSVLFKKKTWVGYYDPSDHRLPKLRSGVFSPDSPMHTRNLDEATKQHLSFLYAKDYSVGKDLEIVSSLLF